MWRWQYDGSRDGDLIGQHYGQIRPVTEPKLPSSLLIERYYA